MSLSDGPKTNGPTYDIVLSRRADRYYNRVDPIMVRRLNRCFDELRRDPFASRNVRPIRGSVGTYRYRVGNLRVMFTVDQDSHSVDVVAIGPRGEIY